jgi:hypothetical protein
MSLSEPMAFGIGSGLYFAHMPFFKVMDLPVTTFRSLPGTLFKKACKRLAIPYETQKFRDHQKGMEAVDTLIGRGIPVGMQANIYWLPYFSKQFRFQFNGHNLIVYGKTEDNYLVSDPVVDNTSICDKESLRRARFARGPLAPKGLIYYFTETRSAEELQLRLQSAVRTGLQETIKNMVGTPMPFLGTRGIRYLSKNIRKWPSKYKSEADVLLNLGNIVRMQEEIGTGGAGFRYLYSAFLQEAAPVLKNDALLQASQDLTAAGDVWREFAVKAARLCRAKSYQISDIEEAADILVRCAQLEEDVFQNLRKELR